jgi:hypothetical protein
MSATDPCLLESNEAVQRPDSAVPVPLQSSNPDVLNQWPHALHLLGLIYNQQL